MSAILHDQENEDAPFDGFEDSESGRLVSKAIERMSLGADSDTNENQDQNPVPVYSSSLLQQFVEKTALLSEPRKRRGNKAQKKLNEPEYASASNVSPDSGIQSVNNSPLHLAPDAASPTASSAQSPVQSKPVVNVDRVLYPPKRKPGRPAKIVSSQPRGPGRPKLKPEIVAKIEKIVKNQVAAKAKENARKKATLSKKKEEQEEEGKEKVRTKGRKAAGKKPSKGVEASHSERRKCLRKLVHGKRNSRMDEKAYKARPERVVAKKSEQKEKSKSVAKENRESGGNRKPGVGKKMVASQAARRVLKENKGNKKAAGGSESNAVGRCLSYIAQCSVLGSSINYVTLLFVLVVLAVHKKISLIICI